MSQSPRRFQFGLRKLLLWTAVLAVYCGILRTFNAGLAVILVYTSWLGTVGVVRVAVSARAAAVLSAAVGAIYGAYLLSRVPPSFAGAVILDVLLVVLLCGMYGLYLCGLVDVVIRVVDWADEVMRDKTDD